MNLPSLAAETAPAPTPPIERAPAVAAVLLAMALVVIDAGMVNVALPSIVRDLEITPAMSVRIVLAYQIALVVALLPAAALAEIIGYRRTFSAGVVLFIAGSFLCAAAPSLTWLIAMRFVQGLGGAAIMALGIALLRQSLRASRMGAAIGWNAMTVAIGSAAGPVIGALIISSAAWQWLFVVHLPLGFLALGFSRALPVIAGSRGRLDLVSIALNVLAFVSFIMGMQLSLIHI